MVDGQLKRSVRFQRQRQHDGLLMNGTTAIGRRRLCRSSTRRTGGTKIMTLPCIRRVTCRMDLSFQ